MVNFGNDLVENLQCALQHLALSCHKLIRLRHFSDSYGNAGSETATTLGISDLDSSSLLLASRRTSAKVRQVCTMLLQSSRGQTDMFRTLVLYSQYRKIIFSNFYSGGRKLVSSYYVSPIEIGVL